MTEQRLSRNVRLLGWASCLNDVASEMIYPLLPRFLTVVLGGSRWQLGLIEGITDAVASLLKLWSGRRSDRTGRRDFVILGYALATVSRPLIGLAAAPWQVLPARFADRTGKGLRTAPRDALIADSTPRSERGRAFGFQRAMDHLGAAVGPALAAAFLWYRPDDLRTLFLLSVVPGLAVVLLLFAGLRETPAPTDGSDAASLAVPPDERSLQQFLVASFVFTLGKTSDAFLLLRAGELGVSTTRLPLLWGAFHVVKCVCSLAAGRLVDRVGPRFPLLAGWLLFAAVYAAFGLAESEWQAWLLFAVYGACHSASQPAERTLVAELVGGRTGTGFGRFHFAVGIAALPASLVFGVLYDLGGPLAAFGWGAGLALVAAILLQGVRPVPQGTP